MNLCVCLPAAPTPEAEASQSLLASAKAKVESFSVVGKRLVSNKEWELLQQEVSQSWSALRLLGHSLGESHPYTWGLPDMARKSIERRLPK